VYNSFIHQIDQLIANINEQTVFFERLLILTAIADLAIMFSAGLFIFQAGRWYERSLTKKQREDDYWEPKEPTL
jgi:hypothetical protein